MAYYCIGKLKQSDIEREGYVNDDCNLFKEIFDLQM